jgi:hypothetical protein
MHCQVIVELLNVIDFDINLLYSNEVELLKRILIVFHILYYTQSQLQVCLTYVHHSGVYGCKRNL